MQNAMTRIWDALPSFLSNSLAWLRQTLMPSVGVAAVNISALIICSGVISLMWAYIEPGPFSMVRVVKVEPANRTLHRDRMESLLVTREIEMRFGADVHIGRVWIDASGVQFGTVDDWVYLEKGRAIRDPIRVIAPASLPPGTYRYRVTLRWCNAIKCVNKPLEDLPVVIVGDRPPDDAIPESRF